MAPSIRGWLLLTLCLGVATTIAQFDPSDPDAFLRAARWRATLINNYVYIDGGEVSQEGHVDDHLFSNILNNTLSIDCSRSWSPDTVEIRELDRPETIPILSEQSILTDRINGSFYIFGGYHSSGKFADNTTLWKFSPGREGDGNWSQEALSNRTMFIGMNRTHTAASASSNDAGFVFGGMITDDKGRWANVYQKGFVVLNFTTGEWSERLEKEDTPYSSDGTLMGSQAVYVERYGAMGLVFILGGVTMNEYVDFEELHFYDIAAQKWYSQRTTGDIPPTRYVHCATGVGGSEGNDTYEIFVYGGRNNDEFFSEVYVLSLPGFNWKRVDDGGTDYQRANHVCLTAGNSQLLSLGGLDSPGFSLGDWASKDPLPRGIGIFDLNFLEWRDTYTPGAYRTHETIADWYTEGLESLKWSSTKLQALFGQSSDGNSTGGDTSNTGGGTSGTGEDDPDSNSDSDSSASTPVEVTVGAVVAGVAAFVIIGAVLLFLVFRKRRRDSEEAPSETDEAKTELDSQPVRRAAELQNSSDPSYVHPELSGCMGKGFVPTMVTISELDGTPNQRSQ